MNQRRRSTEHGWRRVAEYDIRPVARTRRVPKVAAVQPKPDISVYRVRGFGQSNNRKQSAAPKRPLDVTKSLPSEPRAAQPKLPLRQSEALRTAVGRNKTRKSHRKVQRRSQIVLTVLAAVVFLVGVGASVDGFRKNQAVEAQITHQANGSMATGESDNLDDTEPTPGALKSHTVPTDAPRYITINSIGVHARIKALDTKANGELETPKNIFDVGWYRSGNKPGQDGAMLMDGHVSSPRKAGVFKNLPKLKTGDIIAIERGDGKVFQYKVVKTKVFSADKVDMASTVVSITPGKAGLNLITCHGKVKPGTHDFSERFVVYAEEI